MLGQITLDLRWWALTANLGAHQGGGIYVELDFSEHTKTVLQVGLFFYFLGIKDIDRNAMTICKEHNGKLGRIVCSVSAENSS